MSRLRRPGLVVTDSEVLDAAMRLAVEESASALGVSSPNPPVGAVIVSRDGDVAAAGHTQPPGGPHAEVVALRAAGPAARGATAVVTLEPCNHTCLLYTSPSPRD